MELFKLLGTIAVDNQSANASIDETTGKAEGSESKMTAAFKKIGTAVVTYFAVDKIVAFGKEIVNTMASFEDAMLKVQSLSGATQDEYKQLSDAALDYGSKTAWTSKDVADAMGYMALAGFETSEILASTSGMLSLASASGEDLATVTDILTDAMTGFGDSADQAGRYADVLATVQAKSNTTVGLLGEAFKYVSPLAGSYGYALEDVAAALGLMANSGVKGSMAGTALSSMLTRLATDAGASSKSLGALGTLTEVCGVEFYNADGSTRSLSVVLKELCDATKDFTVEEKAAIAKTIAGQEAQKGLLAILNQGSEAYEELHGKLTDCNGAATNMAENMESGLGGAIRNIQSAFEGFKITLGQQFSEPLGTVIREIAGWINGTLTPALGTIGTALSVAIAWFQEMYDRVSAHLPAIQATFMELWAVAQVVWATVGQPIFNMIQTAVEIVYNAFAAKMPEIKAFVSQCFADIKTFWENNLQPCLQAIGDFIRNILAPAFAFVFNEFIVARVESAFKFIKDLWEYTLKPIFVGITDFLTGVFTGNWKQAFEGLVKIVEGIFNGIVNRVKYPINKVIDLVNSFIKGLNKLQVPDWVPGVGGKGINIPLIPTLEKGGILEKGQVGLLEGNGAEAVVPLHQNRAWISAVARDMDSAFGGKETVGVLNKILEAINRTNDGQEDLKDSFASMKVEMNNREFARLVKAVN